MSDTYLKAILVSAIGGLYMIAYSLYFIGDQLNFLRQINPKYYFVHLITRGCIISKLYIEFS